MKTSRSLVLGTLAFTLAIMVGWNVVDARQAAPQNESLANRVLAVRQQDAALAKQYSWNSRVELLHKGTVQDIRIELVSTGATGAPERTLLNDTPGALPHRFLRKLAAENQRKELEGYLENLHDLAEQYTLPSAGKVLEYLVQAKVQPIRSPAGNTLLQATGNSLVLPGDTFVLTLDGATFRTRRVEIATTYQGDPVTLTATYTTTKGGLTYPQYCTVEVPSKEATVMIHNFDCVPND